MTKRDNEKIIQIHAEALGSIKISIAALLEVGASANTLRGFVECLGVLEQTGNSIGEPLESRGMAEVEARYGHGHSEFAQAAQLESIHDWQLRQFEEIKRELFAAIDQRLREAQADA